MESGFRFFAESRLDQQKPGQRCPEFAPELFSNFTHSVWNHRLRMKFLSDTLNSNHPSLNTHCFAKRQSLWLVLVRPCRLQAVGENRNASQFACGSKCSGRTGSIGSRGGYRRPKEPGIGASDALPQEIVRRQTPVRLPKNSVGSPDLSPESTHEFLFGFCLLSGNSVAIHKMPCFDQTIINS